MSVFDLLNCCAIFKRDRLQCKPHWTHIIADIIYVVSVYTTTLNLPFNVYHMQCGILKHQYNIKINLKTQQSTCTWILKENLIPSILR